MTGETDSLRYEVIPDGVQIILHGPGEHELDLAVTRLMRGFQIELEIGAPQVAYRETNRGFLEPMMKAEIVTPEEYLGDVVGDLMTRRGQIQGMDSRGTAQVLTALVPLANMFGYVNNLGFLTQGRGHYTMHFDRYEEVPPSADIR
jgi:translation elongation factor EF-G